MTIYIQFPVRSVVAHPFYYFIQWFWMILAAVWASGSKENILWLHSWSYRSPPAAWFLDKPKLKPGPAVFGDWFFIVHTISICIRNGATLVTGNTWLWRTFILFVVDTHLYQYQDRDNRHIFTNPGNIIRTSSASAIPSPSLSGHPFKDASPANRRTFYPGIDYTITVSILEPQQPGAK